MKANDLLRPFLPGGSRLPVALLLAGAIVMALPQTADAQRTSLRDIDRKVDDIQDTLGPVPGPSGQDLQQQIDELRDILCDIAPPGVSAKCNKVVFAAFDAFGGNLGGLAGADRQCNLKAQAAGLPGSYKAWLSDSTGSPSTRFTRSTVPYVLVNGTVVADNYQDLTDGSLDAPINRGEANQPLGAILIWTGTNANGTAAADNCRNWTSSSFLDSGVVGITNQSSSLWTNRGSVICPTEFVSLYCFQQ